ncbi:Protein of uncharacterised function (DUF2971) (plasmid) [Legionella adelaidensis]|uniref:Protein of uncharacterized function (DUF2971) n=1 Tax=Legionella adelaidensis TaxID=45056 RepID=A0A0W0R1Y9_9GAMM|nr:DUF2971 domain-containing protein [Legionella adelaidensis]KTC64987.1 hypothetical protein Lade_1667 [Legionella adelaidensis]VEH85333.1 Protein of uncharacterised function (DUF2971) [Legionella adelaidensis]
MRGKEKDACILYHYTSHNTLYEIVTTKALIASHVYYLNDSHEIKYGMSHFTELLDELSKEKKYACYSILFEQIYGWLKSIKKNPPFIFSFSLSEKGNLLSQWRAYTPCGIGVSIGFKKHDLDKYAAKHALSLMKCIYNKEEQLKEVNHVLNSILQLFDEHKPSFSKRKLEEDPKFLKLLNHFKVLLLNTFIQIKDPVFYEEREWRLVSKVYEDALSKEIKFRSSKTTLIPYILFDIKNLRKDGTLFEHVYVGPSPNFDLLYPAIVALLTNTHACQSTLNAIIPYREI